MARSWFGGTHADVILGRYRFGNRTLLAETAGTVKVTLWDAEMGGTQYTDLLDEAGLPITSILSDDGYLPRFQGPDAVTAMWEDDGDSERRLLEARDLAAANTLATQVAADKATVTVLHDATEGYRNEVLAVGNTNDGIMAAEINDDLSATRAALDDFYPPRTLVDVWSLPLTPGGVGGGGVIMDEGAAAFIVKNTSANDSKGYIAIGRDALGLATRARSCIAIGQNAIGKGNPGFDNLAIGAYALTHVEGISSFGGDTEGARNIGIGSLAGHFLTSGYRNVLMGRDSGHSITTGYSNVALGYRALSTGYAPLGFTGEIENHYPAAAEVFESVAVGESALTNVVGDGNVAVGFEAAQNAKNIGNSVFIGWRAAGELGVDLSENNKVITRPVLAGTFTQNGTTITVNAVASGVVVGNKVGVRFTTGTLATTTGTNMQWVTVVTAPSADVFTVTSPVSQSDSGDVVVDIVETATVGTMPGSNVVIGFSAMQNAETTGGNNVIVGESTGIQSTGAQNTLVGGRSGFNLTTGAQVVGLGYNSARATIAGAQIQAETNITCLGYDTRISGSNQVQLGNSLTTTYAYGAVANRSDLRDKADVQDTALGLDFIQRLRPVDFRWAYREDGGVKRTRFHHGLIAQDVQQVIADTGTDFGGYQDHQIGGGDDVLSLGYTELIAPLIKAVQELSATVAEQADRIAQLEAAP